ncbi:MAG TPA: nuclear transport factor 2 family protein [Acidobacteriaceae bacterium]|nr:nuclear transport factor 2 family protein [Acidobacteriaceae bacterium]
MRAQIAAVFLACFALSAASPAQMLDPLAPKPSTSQAGNPLTDPTLSPGVEMLYQLDAKFSDDTAKGGGAAFAAWFAPDAVTLANGKAPVVGHDAIAAAATWTPASYQLTWIPEGARLAASGDMGVTWGHYTGVSKDQEGNAVKTSGRYMTVWKKQPDGQWKVELDASNDGPAADCCRLR